MDSLLWSYYTLLVCIVHTIFHIWYWILLGENDTILWSCIVLVTRLDLFSIYQSSMNKDFCPLSKILSIHQRSANLSSESSYHHISSLVELHAPRERHAPDISSKLDWRLRCPCLNTKFLKLDTSNTGEDLKRIIPSYERFMILSYSHRGGNSWEVKCICENVYGAPTKNNLITF